MAEEVDAKPIDPMNDEEHSHEGAVRAADKSEDESLRKLREYATPIGTGVILALIAYFGYTFWNVKQENTAQQAAELYAQADSPEALSLLIEDYPASSVAPAARLSLASQQFHNGEYETAMASYQNFLDNHPEHLLAPAAKLGQAYCLEALGRVEESLTQYIAFTADFEAHYMKPMAVFGHARSLEQLGRFDEAKSIYEGFITNNPNSDWVIHAESALRFLNMQQRVLNG